MNKRLATFALAAFTISNSIAQVLKTYTGDYELSYPFSQNGTATYTYYENKDTYERVKQGAFKFTFHGNGNYKGVTIIITGNYKRNLKSGQWTYTMITKDFKVPDEPYLSGTATMIANYKDGIPNGIWEAKWSETYRKLVFDRVKREMVLGTPSLPKTTYLKTNFSNGDITGVFTFSENDTQLKKIKKLDFTCDTSSFINGKLVFRHDKTEEIYHFKKGFLLKNIERNIQSGEVSENVTHDLNEKLLTLFNKQKLVSSDSMALIKKMYGEMIYPDRRFKYIIVNTLFNDFYLFKDIKGDEHFDADGYLWGGMGLRYNVKNLE